MENNEISNSEDVQALFKRLKLEEWKDVEIKIAVTGNSGVGKSSLINAITGVKMADTGVKETTKEPTEYTHPENEKMKLWDLPKKLVKVITSTPSCPDHETYCKKVDLKKYDTFLILTAGRFTENDLQLAKTVESINKSFFFVRTKIDQDIKNELYDHKKSEESTLNEIGEDCRKSLSDLPACKKNLFLVSNRHKDKWDFPGLTQALLEALPLRQKEKLKNVEINIAVTGNSGVGKSSLINNVIGVKMADTGVEETTKEPTEYTHPENERIKLWDLPGIGTPSCPDHETYCKKVDLKKYDTFLILTAGRFTENDLQLAKTVESINKSFSFVRTKIDQDIESEWYDNQKSEESTLIEIREDCRENLSDLPASKKNVFLISNHHRDKWDFPCLTQAIQEALPPRQKQSLTSSLKSDSKDVMRRKVEVLQGDPLDFKEGKWEQEYKKDVEKHVKKHGVDGIKELLTANLERWKDVEIHFGITGDSGVGKSSFINAVRGLKDDDEDAAETGVTETTTEAKGYRHPRNNNIVFWDLPGVGTPTFPDIKTYCDEVGFKKYDTFLIMASKRFTKYDQLLVKEVKSLKKPFFFVRTHIDENCRAESRRDNFDEKKMLDHIKGDCLKYLKVNPNPNPKEKKVFLISNNDPDKWDFPRLIKAIEEDLPFHQKESLMLSLTSFSKELVAEKTKILRGRIWMVAATSGATALVPIPGLSVALDLALLTKEVNFYKSQLGLPEENSKVFIALSAGMKAKIRTFCTRNAVNFGKRLVAYTASSAVEEFTRYIPFLGWLIAGSISFTTTYCVLYGILNELEQTAMDLLDEIKANGPDQC